MDFRKRKNMNCIIAQEETVALESVWPWWIRLKLKDVTGLAAVASFIFVGLFSII